MDFDTRSSYTNVKGSTKVEPDFFVWEGEVVYKGLVTCDCDCDMTWDVNQEFGNES